MKRLIHTHPRFLAVSAALAMVAAAETAWMFDQRAEAHAALSRWKNASERLRALETSVPPPAERVAVLLEEEGQRAAAVLETLRTEVFGGGPNAEPAPPRDRAEAFFRIAAFVDALRADFRQAGIHVREEESFGFASYARSGPERAVMMNVHQQGLVTRVVVQALIAAGPRALHRIAREPPGDGRRLTEGDAAEDFFVMDPGLSCRRPGLVDGWAIQVVFTGYTRTLRAFFDRLAASGHPLAVRDLAVEPAPSVPARAWDGSPGEGEGGAGAETVVTAEASRFTVTLEYLERAVETLEGKSAR